MRGSPFFDRCFLLLWHAPSICRICLPDSRCDSSTLLSKFFFRHIAADEKFITPVVSLGNDGKSYIDRFEKSAPKWSVLEIYNLNDDNLSIIQAQILIRRGRKISICIFRNISMHKIIELFLAFIPKSVNEADV